LALQRELSVPHVPFGSISVTPSRKIEPFLIDQRRADDEPEDRTPVITATGF